MLIGHCWESLGAWSPPPSFMTVPDPALLLGDFSRVVWTPRSSEALRILGSGLRIPASFSSPVATVSVHIAALPARVGPQCVPESPPPHHRPLSLVRDCSLSPASSSPCGWQPVTRFTTSGALAHHWFRLPGGTTCAPPCFLHSLPLVPPPGGASFPRNRGLRGDSCSLSPAGGTHVAADGGRHLAPSGCAPTPHPTLPGLLAWPGVAKSLTSLDTRGSGPPLLAS